MTFEVRIPTLGESVTEGVIVRWAKQDGEAVKPDDVLLELETDKASMEIPAERAGVLRIVKQAGETVPAFDVIYGDAFNRDDVFPIETLRSF